MSTSRESKATSPRQPHHHRRRSEPIQQPFLSPPQPPRIPDPSRSPDRSVKQHAQHHHHQSHVSHVGAHLAAPGAYLRPSNSRHHSSQSVGSNMSGSSRRPHPQQREYVPSPNAGAAFVGGIGNDGLGDDAYNERFLYDEAAAAADGELSSSTDHSPTRGDPAPAYTPSPGQGGSQTVSPGGLDWDNLRDGSIARRPRWRRPSPAWIYPFIVGATLAMGMGMAPKSELFINLACLAHPPQAPAGASGLSALQIHALHGSAWSMQQIDTGLLNGNGNDDQLSINSTIPASPSSPTSNDPPLSAADRWFLKIQHDIYEYKLHHHRDDGPIDKPPSTTIPTRPMPSGPLPRPSEPSDRDGDDGQSGDGEGTGSPDRRPLPSSPSSPSQGNSPYHEIDPRLCKRDPGVQATAARLSMVITLTAGILAALTTGFWGQTSDRKGRTKVLALCQSGLMLNDMCFILVASFPYLAPGGYRALLIGPALDGLLGGFSTISATINAYMSDVTPDGSRAAAFARLGGIAMTGFACGPILGSALIKATGNIMAPFYVSVCVHATFVLLFSFLLPESLSTEARQILAKNAKLAREAAKRQDAIDRAWENETPAAVEVTDPLLGVGGSGRPRMYGAAQGMESGWSRMSFTAPPGASKRRKQITGRLYRLGRLITKPFQPLAIFLPMEGEDGKKVWGLTYVGIGQFCLSMLMGVMMVKTQFAFYSYGWTSTQLGPYMSLMGFSRGIVLIVLMPMALHFLRPFFRDPREVVTAPAADPGASAISSSSSTSDHDAGPSTGMVGTTEADNKPLKRRTAKLDLLIIRWSLFLEAFLYLAIAFNPSQELFVVLTVALTLGSGSGPATSSLALSFLPSSAQAGRLFGGLSVLNALGSTMISPLLFGTLFSYTVGWYAPTVFALASGILFLAWSAFMCVRIPGSNKASRAERGRSRRVKRMNSSSVHVQ